MRHQRFGFLLGTWKLRGRGQGSATSKFLLPNPDEFFSLPAKYTLVISPPISCCPQCGLCCRLHFLIQYRGTASPREVPFSSLTPESRIHALVCLCAQESCLILYVSLWNYSNLFPVMEGYSPDPVIFLRRSLGGSTRPATGYGARIIPKNCRLCKEGKREARPAPSDCVQLSRIMSLYVVQSTGRVPGSSFSGIIGWKETLHTRQALSRTVLVFWVGTIII